MKRAWPGLAVSITVSMAVSMPGSMAVSMAVSMGLFGTELLGAEQAIHIPFEKYKLGNGLRVVLARDSSAPVIAVYVIYDVGARVEEKGRTGFAHLFEHMMFEGSANVKKGEHFRQIATNGGEVNGSTHLDYTDFYETLPANRLALALWLESDRMRGLAITEENLRIQKEAVKQERRGNFSQPYREAIAQWPAFAFGNFHNAHPVIGASADDLDAATVDDVSKFFYDWYAPNNAVVTISGDFDPAEAKKLVGGYFGDIAAQALPKLTEAPRAEGRTATIKDPLARVPALIAGWPAPARHSTDWYAIQMIDAVLTSGEGARLKLQMLKGRQSLLQADANLGWPAATALDFKEPADYATIFVYKPNYSAEEILAQYQAEVDRIARDGVGGTELGRVKAVLRFQMASGIQTALSRAKLLGIGELMDGDAGGAEKDAANLLSVTSEQMQAAAKKYLAAGRRDVMVIEPAGAKQ
jgi:predicted Zn-dependent peptidase